MEAIFTRRSIRKYKDTKVSGEKIDILLKAAMHAPNAGDQRTWHFIVLTNKEKMLQIPIVHPYAEMMRIAPVAIIVCGDILMEKHRGFWQQDCAAASQNILLAAHDLGLGGCWLGVHPIEERIAGIKEILQLPENIIPMSIIPLGYPDEIPEPKQKGDADRIHYDSW
ncbi:MAG: nitroreductase family protein [Bacteroidetes bacterium]|nr:nitroreductase family protein [Bacteroidota bacterium]MBU1719562.1 nitroreductase family protein [Bacteroidota bacterium]